MEVCLLHYSSTYDLNFLLIFSRVLARAQLINDNFVSKVNRYLFFEIYIPLTYQLPIDH